MPKVELNLEDDELKELLLGDRDKAMQSILSATFYVPRVR